MCLCNLKVIHTQFTSSNNTFNKIAAMPGKLVVNKVQAAFARWKLDDIYIFLS